MESSRETSLLSGSWDRNLQSWARGTCWIFPRVSCKWRNLSLHIALRVELSEDSLPGLCLWTDAMRTSEVPLYSAAGKLDRLFSFPRLNQVFSNSWAEKKKKAAVLFQSNQTKETVRIYAGLEPWLLILTQQTQWECEVSAKATSERCHQIQCTMQERVSMCMCVQKCWKLEVPRQFVLHPEIFQQWPLALFMCYASNVISHTAQYDEVNALGH